MALDKTTRQVNLRVIAALAESNQHLGEANYHVLRAVEPLDDMSVSTNAHDAALEELRAVAIRIRAAREDVSRRLTVESEGR